MEQLKYIITVKNFKEKPKGDGSKINGGFFVLNNNVFDYTKDDKSIWEEDPLINLTNDGELMAYDHSGFWQLGYIKR